MVRNHIALNNKKERAALIATAGVTVMLVLSIATIGSAPFSVQQRPGGGPPGQQVTSENIVDGEVRNQDLADDAVTSEKIRDGEVTIDDLDPAIDIGGEGSMPAFTLQVTQRSEEIIVEGGLPNIHRTVSGNDDEQVVGGGFQTFSLISISRQNEVSNGWEVRIQNPQSGFPHEIYAECAKIVPVS